MPKFLYAKLTVKTFEVEAEDEEEATTFVEAYNNSVKLGTPRTEEIKVTNYKLQWEEDPEHDPTIGRNKVLAAFLHLMQDIIPGMPPRPEQKKNLIILPFEREVEN